MSQLLQTIAIIRQRGQLTIPDFIRQVTGWVSSGSVVSVSRVRADEIIIKPHATAKSQTNWDRLWRNIELSRSHKGKYNGRLSRFIVEDRQSH